MMSLSDWDRKFKLHPVYKEARWPNSYLVQALVPQPQPGSLAHSKYQSAALYFSGQILPVMLSDDHSCDDGQAWEMDLLESSLKAERSARRLKASEIKASEIKETNCNYANNAPVVTVATRVRLGD